MRARASDTTVAGGERSVRLLASGALGLLIALLCVLALTASAQAAEPGAETSGAIATGSEGTSAPAGDEAGASTSAPAETTPTPPAQEETAAPPPAQEETATAQSAPEQPAVTQTPPAETTPAETTQAPIDESAPAPEQTQPAETTTPPDETTTPPVETTSKPAESTPVVVEETPTPVLVSEEASAPKRTSEETLVTDGVSEDKPAAPLEETTIVAHGGAGGQDSTPQSASATPPGAPSTSSEGTQPLAGALIGSIASAPNNNGPRVPPPSTGNGASASTIAVPSGGEDDFACPLASLEHRMPGICSGWLRTQRVLSTSSIAAAIAAASSPSQTGAASGDGHAPSV
ncbi:MAG TPA: hypothetical protein VN889_02815, partial [Solirubrobacteraceae bacterium]|nr:hypothetical protein [Solirubrobacteraceae bacterium]